MIFSNKVILQVDRKGDLPLFELGVLFEAFEEGDDFRAKLLAGLGGGFSAPHDAGAFLNIAKANRFGPAFPEKVDFLGQEAEKDEFESIAGFASGFDQGNGDGGSEGNEVVGDGVATDFAKHDAHAFVEVFEREHPKRAAVLEVVHHAVANVVDKGKVVAVARDGRPAQGFVNPLGAVADHMMVAYFEHGEVADDADH